MTTFDQRNQQSSNQYNAAGNINFYQQVSPRQVDAATLVAAEEQLATLPLETIPDVAFFLAGSRLPAANPLFVGRQKSLQTLAIALKGTPKSGVGYMPIVAVSGIGGIGKTQLVSEFVHRYGQYFTGGVIWLNCTDANAMRAEVAACLSTIELGSPHNTAGLPIDDQVRLVLSTWLSQLPRLLVFDNCEDESLFAQWRPPTGGCHILLTSHRPKWSPELGITVLPLSELDREESIALLSKHRSDLSAHDLDSVAEALGDLPLALHLAGSFLSKYRDTRLGVPEAYLKELHKVTLHHPSLQGRGLSYSATGHEQNVERTFTLIFERLDTTDPIDIQAIRLLTRAAFFAPGEPISRDLLLATLKQEDDTVEAELQIQDALDRLVNLGLLETQSSESSRLHRLLAEFVRMQSNTSDSDAQAAVEQVMLETASTLNDAGYPLPMIRLQPHMRMIVKMALQREDERSATLSYLLGSHLFIIGAYTEAQDYLELSLMIRQQILGPEHPDVAQSLSNLAGLYHAQGRYAEAEPLFEQAITILERNSGLRHPRLARIVNRYADLLRKTKRNEQADTLIEHYENNSN